MIRKQLYIEERQEKALKRRAKALVVSEANIMRQALDTILGSGRKLTVIPNHREALRDLLERASQFAASRQGLPKARG